jgi:hypothetical protein
MRNDGTRVEDVGDGVDAVGDGDENDRNGTDLSLMMLMDMRMIIRRMRMNLVSAITNITST